MLYLCIVATVKIVLALRSMPFLHLMYGMDHDKALWYVQMRVNNRGYPLFNLARQNSDLMKWVESNLGAALDAESGICCWEYGSHCV